MLHIKQPLLNIRKKITAIATANNRLGSDVNLLAVSKTQPPSCIREAYQAGQTAFGENHLQEARDKQQVLNDLDISWHFIGSIQSNKTRKIAEHFQWVHSVDRLQVAQRLSQQRPNHLPPLNICLQINIDNEATKSGIPLNELSSLANMVNTLPQLRLRGLMIIPAKRDNPSDQRAIFNQAAEIFRQLKLTNPALRLDTLSMGMSDDMEAAIAAGSTIVRVGRAIFGPRDIVGKPQPLR
ncbi:YggS family pyridoxal phosphate enzyme [Candidatus Endobugula sertula]|uniref:Pyridoxal phosphate homeostasis protein n=1 Tax=Candidatus Endobugula sertula TaxID=62101 RepID=A0A1D2QSP6_9GAMM|nr:YggS family pyridoxal phosphate enzyme [Candidatus Endobugula sertula]